MDGPLKKLAIRFSDGDISRSDFDEEISDIVKRFGAIKAPKAPIVLRETTVLEARQALELEHLKKSVVAKDRDLIEKSNALAALTAKVGRMEGTVPMGRGRGGLQTRGRGRGQLRDRPFFDDGRSSTHCRSQAIGFFQ